MDLITTVVGSYPSELDRATLERAYRRGEDPFHEALEEAVRGQVDAGIMLVSDGQTRGDMISIFARGLRGFRIKERVEIISRVSYRSGITVEDQIKAKSLLPPDVGLKAIITGPYTLMKSSRDLHYHSQEECMADIAEALHREAEALAEICDVIQLDEPFLSIEYQDNVREHVERVLQVDVETALHVCGDVGEIAHELVEFEVDILDHEFTSHPHLYDVYGDLDTSKHMAVGVVDTTSRVEGVDVIAERIERVLDTFGPGSHIDPDCGLRNLPGEVAREKLKNMVIAREMVLDERC